MSLREHLLSSWQRPSFLTYVLMPLSWVYRCVFAARKLGYRLGLFSSYHSQVPVIVVGNLTVGGTGKTPLVIYLVELLRENGFSPAVISRGYSGDAPHYPFEVSPETSVKESGDEPALIVKRTNVPMVVGPNRGANIDLLLAKNSVDVIVSDDGLQHLALQRDMEVCLVDDTANIKNTNLLPAGPYREPLSRLNSVDFVVHHQQVKDQIKHDNYTMTLQAGQAKPLTSQQVDSQLGQQKQIHAVAGIGNPERFFKTCELEGYTINKHSFPDHHHFQEADLVFGDDEPILMTEKDAVKCQNFKLPKAWYLPVDAQLSKGFSEALLSKLNKIIETKNTL